MTTPDPRSDYHPHERLQLFSRKRIARLWSESTL